MPRAGRTAQTVARTRFCASGLGRGGVAACGAIGGRRRRTGARELRQRHQQAAALANTQQAEFLAEDQQRALRSEWADAQADYTTAEAREQEYIQRLIPATTAALTTAQAAYQVGKTPLSSVWQARRAVLAVELEHWLIRIDRLRALVRLQYIVGNEGVMQ